MLPVALLALAAGLPGLHQNSTSRTLLEVRSDHLRVVTLVQPLSVLEVLPELDANQDGVLGRQEFDRQGDLIRDYVALHQTVSGPDGTGLALQADEVTWLEHDPLDGEALGLKVERRISWDAIPEALEVSMDLFLLTSPTHVDDVIVLWEDGVPARRLLDAAAPSHRFVRPPSLRGQCVVGGLRHGATGALLWLCIGLLVATSRPSRDLALFGLASFLGLALFPSAPLLEARMLGLAIAMAATYQGAELALQPERRARSGEALVFGLLAGLSTGYLGPDLVPGANGRLHGALLLIGALTPGLALGGMARWSLPVARWVGLLVAVGGGVFFVLRAIGTLAPGL